MYAFVTFHPHHQTIILHTAKSQLPLSLSPSLSLTIRYKQCLHRIRRPAPISPSLRRAKVLEPQRELSRRRLIDIESASSVTSRFSMSYGRLCPIRKDIIPGIRAAKTRRCRTYDAVVETCCKGYGTIGFYL